MWLPVSLVLVLQGPLSAGRRVLHPADLSAWVPLSTDANLSSSEGMELFLSQGSHSSHVKELSFYHVRSSSWLLEYRSWIPLWWEKLMARCKGFFVVVVFLCFKNQIGLKSPIVTYTLPGCHLVASVGASVLWPADQAGVTSFCSFSRTDGSSRMW